MKSQNFNLCFQKRNAKPESVAMSIGFSFLVRPRECFTPDCSPRRISKLAVAIMQRSAVREMAWSPLKNSTRRNGRSWVGKLSVNHTSTTSHTKTFGHPKRSIRITSRSKATSSGTAWLGIGKKTAKRANENLKPEQLQYIIEDLRRCHFFPSRGKNDNTSRKPIPSQTKAVQNHATVKTGPGARGFAAGTPAPAALAWDFRWLRSGLPMPRLPARQARFAGDNKKL